MATKIHEKINNSLKHKFSLHRYYLLYFLSPIFTLGVKQFIIHLLHFFIGTRHYLFIKNIINNHRGRKVSTGKDFSVKDVERIIEKIVDTDPCPNAYSIESYASDSILRKHISYGSIKIKLRTNIHKL